MPTQSMSPAAIHEAYGRVGTLRDAIADQPIAPGMPAGSVTDDTEQALIVANLIIEGKGHIDPKEFAKCLLAWEDDMKSRGSFDLLGPSTKLALEQVRRCADIMTTGRTGTTNGAAMRVTPVGIANRPEDTKRLANRIYESCQVTHDTVAGFQSAALIATTVSLGLEGMTVRQALNESLRLVPAMETPGPGLPRRRSPHAPARQYDYLRNSAMRTISNATSLKTAEPRSSPMSPWQPPSPWPGGLPTIPNRLCSLRSTLAVIRTPSPQ